MNLDEAIRCFLKHRQARRVASGTFELYSRQLADWSAWRASHGLNEELTTVSLDELRDYLYYLATERQGRHSNEPGCAPNTVHSMHRTLRALWNFLSYEEDAEGVGILKPTQERFFKNGRIPLPAIPKRERPAISPQLLDALLEAVGDDHDEQSERNRAILLLLYESGLRAYELCSLHDADVDLRDRAAVIIGKGDKEAVIFWGPRAHDAILKYLRLRRGPLGGPLLRGCSSRNDGGPITDNLIRMVVKGLAADAGVVLPKGAPVHAFRHGYARDLRRRGATREEVRDLLRHEDLKTTQIYLGLDEDALGETHRKFYGADEGPKARKRPIVFQRLKERRSRGGKKN
jgi:site-specific recombinase XerD